MRDYWCSCLTTTCFLATTCILFHPSEGPARANEQSNQDALGIRVDHFSLRDFRGKEFRLHDHHDAKAVVIAFLGCECPLAKLYAPRLAELAKEYKASGVLFVGLDANVQDAVTEMAHYVQIHGIRFPFLKDVGNRVADRLHAERTPEVFVLDEDRIVRYVGRIDDQYDIGIARTQPETRYLANALDAVLADKDVALPWTDSVGCHIGRVRDKKPNTKVTYAKHISRILQKRCVECHREGEIAPFALTSYEEVYGWAEMIDEVVHQNRMPPWFADPEIGVFSNDCRMTVDEKRRIHSWMLAGAPLGDETELPPPREFTVGWGIPEPDVIIPIAEKPYHVPAEGEVEYQYFVVDPGFTEEKWVQAAECRPGNRTVVHHILVFVKQPGAERPYRGGTIDSDWLAATAPGSPPMNLPDGYAKFIPAGSKFIFQVHYTPNGSPQQDLSCVGLVFADPKTVSKEVGTWRVINTEFEIPPGAPNHVVRAAHTFHRNTDLLALFPHMHLRGKSFRYDARYPDGTEETLLWVPHYDFNWQNSYIFAEPKRLPAGTTMVCTATYDNSEKNPFNPDAGVAVRWGDQTWEEMMIGYYSMVNTDQDLRKTVQRMTDVFLDRVDREGVPKPNATLLALADEALNSHQDIVRFGIALRQIVPQLDRVGLSTLEGGKLHLRLIAQEEALNEHVGRGGMSIPAADMAIAKIAQGDDVMVYQSLAKEDARDLRFMSRMLASSMHVPVKIGGKPSTINFWSDEIEGFPEPAVKLLIRLSRQMARGR